MDLVVVELSVPDEPPRVFERVRHALEHHDAGIRIRIEPRTVGFRLHVDGQSEEPTCIVDVHCSATAAGTHIVVSRAQVTPFALWFFGACTLLATAIGSAVTVGEWATKGAEALLIPGLVTLAFPLIGYVVTHWSQDRADERARRLLSVALAPSHR